VEVENRPPGSSRFSTASGGTRQKGGRCGGGCCWQELLVPAKGKGVSFLPRPPLGATDCGGDPVAPCATSFPYGSSWRSGGGAGDRTRRARGNARWSSSPERPSRDGPKSHRTGSRSGCWPQARAIVTESPGEGSTRSASRRVARRRMWRSGRRSGGRVPRGSGGNRERRRRSKSGAKGRTESVGVVLFSRRVASRRGRGGSADAEGRRAQGPLTCSTGRPGGPRRGSRERRGGVAHGDAAGVR